MNRKFKKILLQVAAVLLIAVMLPACGGSGTGEESSTSTDTSTAVEGNEGVIEGTAATEPVDKVTVSLTTTTVDVSPFAPSTPSIIMKHQLYATMMQRPYYGAPLDECIPWIAKTVTKVDDSHYDIEIYDNIVDSQGNQITADDIVFSYEKSISDAQFVNGGTNMESITKTGDYTLQMVLKNTTPGVIEDLLTHQQLYIVDQGWYESATDEEKMNNPATTGPYKVKSFTSGAGATLEKVDNYWMDGMDTIPPAAVANAEEIVYKVITEPSMRVIALQNHELDLSQINASDISTFYDLSTGQPLEGWNVGIVDSNFAYCMFCNMDSGKSVLADNVDLRKAVFTAIDPSEIMLAAGNLESTSSTINTYGCPSMGGYQSKWDDEPYFDYDPDAAAGYLESAGYKQGEVTIRLLASSALFNDSSISVIVAELNQVDINVDPLIVDQALFSTYKNDSTQWDIMIDVKGAPSGHIVSMWNYAFDPSGYTNGSVCFTHDDQLVALLDEAMSKTDDASIDAFHSYLRDNAICRGLYTTKSVYVAQDGILEMGWFNGSTLVPGDCTFSTTYVPAE
ncbi:MAG: ABC transporter substrate-binding protein [Oscillospiraceae bacterium]|jgi:ABC-type transport system substrate-binding protein